MSADPYARIAAEFAALKEEVRQATRRPMRIPILDADPDSDDPTNVWLFSDGRLRVRLENGSIKEYSPVGTTGATQSGTPRPAPTPPPITRSRTWDATWSGAYKGSGALRSDYPGRVFYGRDPGGYNGVLRSLVGFDGDHIRATLAGASIVKAELYFHNLHFYYNYGGSIKFGVHSNASRPSSYVGALKAGMQSVKFAKEEAKWVRLSNAFVTQIRSGGANGLLIDQQSSATAAYGYGSGAPKLKITYVK